MWDLSAVGLVREVGVGRDLLLCLFRALVLVDGVFLVHVGGSSQLSELDSDVATWGMLQKAIWICLGSISTRLGLISLLSWPCALRRYSGNATAPLSLIARLQTPATSLWNAIWVTGVQSKVTDPL